MSTNPCFYVFVDMFCVLYYYCTHLQAIFSFYKIFTNKFFNTTLKLTRAYFVTENNKK